MDCLFCKIVEGTIPSSKVYEDENVLAFRDIAPQAKVHVLVIPKKHIDSVDCITSENSGIVAKIFEVIPKVAEICSLGEGYRVVSNIGKNGCQSVRHMHFHVLGGEQLTEKMS